MNLGLDERRVLITGASKGIGKAIAFELVEEGARIAICARGESDLEATRAELEERSGRSVFARRCDVTNPDDIITTIAAVVEHFNGLDILINNAGSAHPGRFETLQDDDWRNDIDTKLMSQIRCIRAALPALRSSNHPRIVNVNAIYARYPDPAFIASSVNRASCLSLSKALALELGREQILVNSVNRRHAPMGRYSPAAIARGDERVLPQQSGVKRDTAPTRWERRRGLRTRCLPRLSSSDVHHWRIDRR
jgi:NAD(P)-dependent dehydrogenase (short-subunit alcohol dehydrogenase family)